MATSVLEKTEPHAPDEAHPAAELLEKSKKLEEQVPASTSTKPIRPLRCTVICCLYVVATAICISLMVDLRLASLFPYILPSEFQAPAHSKEPKWAFPLWWFCLFCAIRFPVVAYGYYFPREQPSLATDGDIKYWGDNFLPWNDSIMHAVLAAAGIEVNWTLGASCSQHDVDKHSPRCLRLEPTTIVDPATGKDRGGEYFIAVSIFMIYCMVEGNPFNRYRHYFRPLLWGLNLMLVGKLTLDVGWQQMELMVAISNFAILVALLLAAKVLHRARAPERWCVGKSDFLHSELLVHVLVIAAFVIGIRGSLTIISE